MRPEESWVGALDKQGSVTAVGQKFLRVSLRDSQLNHLCTDPPVPPLRQSENDPELSVRRCANGMDSIKVVAFTFADKR